MQHILCSEISFDIFQPFPPKQDVWAPIVYSTSKRGSSTLVVEVARVSWQANKERLEGRQTKSIEVTNLEPG